MPKCPHCKTGDLIHKPHFDSFVPHDPRTHVYVCFKGEQQGCGYVTTDPSGETYPEFVDILKRQTDVSNN